MKAGEGDKLNPQVVLSGKEITGVLGDSVMRNDIETLSQVRSDRENPHS